MATVVNNPSGDSSGGMGMLLAAILIIAVIAVLGYVFLPMMRQRAQSGTPTINVPDKVDINVNQPKQ